MIALTYLNPDGSQNHEAMHKAATERAVYMATPWQELPPAHARHRYRCEAVAFEEAYSESLRLVEIAAAIQQDVFRARVRFERMTEDERRVERLRVALECAVQANFQDRDEIRRLERALADAAEAVAAARQEAA